MNNNNQHFYVVCNSEGQYSIWPEDKPLPIGWNIEGEPKNKEECLSYINQVWTDMRPISLREKMDLSTT